MRAHDEARLAGGDAGQRAAALGGRERARQELDRRERADERLDRAHVLVGEHFGRREQRGLAASVEHLEHCPQRHDRLSRADVALQQPAHGRGLGQVGGDVGGHFPLARRELVGQVGVELGEQAPVRQGEGRRGPLARAAGALSQGGLQHVGLLVGHSQAGRAPLFVVFGAVQDAYGFELRGQAMGRQVVAGKRVGDVRRREGLQNGLDGLSDVPRGQPVRGVIDRNGAG